MRIVIILVVFYVDVKVMVFGICSVKDVVYVIFFFNLYWKVSFREFVIKWLSWLGIGVEDCLVMIGESDNGYKGCLDVVGGCYVF